jgi:hypothetical protein
MLHRKNQTGASAEIITLNKVTAAMNDASETNKPLPEEYYLLEYNAV